MGEGICGGSRFYEIYALVRGEVSNCGWGEFSCLFAEAGEDAFHEHFIASFIIALGYTLREALREALGETLGYTLCFPFC